MALRTTLYRRDLLCAMAAASLSVVPAGAGRATAFTPMLGPRCRVLLLNDLAGDVDGLFAAAHMALSPSVDLRGLIGTASNEPSGSAERACELATELLGVLGKGGRVRVLHGAKGKLRPQQPPDRSDGTMAIITEAMRSDTDLPLYVAVGGGLTEIASALLIEPRIATRLTLIWIGGAPYPGGGRGEYNFGIDPVAAMYVFNDTQIPIWQVPSSAYATCELSFAELQVRLTARGRVGSWLYGKAVDAARSFATRFKLNTGETWTFGDSPLVLLSALTSWPPTAFGAFRRFETTGSSRYDEIFAPLVAVDGAYQARSDGRKIRVYQTIDTRMMFEDMFAKLSLDG